MMVGTGDPKELAKFRPEACYKYKRKPDSAWLVPAIEAHLAPR